MGTGDRGFAASSRWFNGFPANRRRRSTLFAVQTQRTRMSPIAALILLARLFRLDDRKLTRAGVMVARAFHEQLAIPYGPFVARREETQRKLLKEARGRRARGAYIFYPLFYAEPTSARANRAAAGL